MQFGSAVKNLYLSSAEFYDIDNFNLAYHDIDFYVQYARRKGGTVLEVACGTGRVAIPLAKAGFNVVGIDLSEPMLSIFRKKLERLNPTVAGRIHLECADMADFDLERKFDLIIIPFRAFQALTSDERVRSALLCLKHHLTERGLLIIDLFKPHWRLDEGWATEEEEFDWVKTIETTGETIVRSEIRRSIDTVRQIIYPEIIFSIESKSGETKRIVEPLALRYYYQYQMEVLLICSGFTIVESFGYYDGRGTDYGSELIFVVTKSDGNAPRRIEDRLKRAPDRN